MNTAPSSLLRSLDSLGVQSIRFRVLSSGLHLRHTVPVAHTAEEEKDKRLSDLSVAGLFSAYSLTPRRGEYELDVENGSLAFIPTSSTQSAAPARLALVKKRRAQSKGQIGRAHV